MKSIFGIALLAASASGQAVLRGNGRNHDDFLQQRRALMGMREKTKRVSSHSYTKSTTTAAATTATADSPAASKGAAMMGKNAIITMLEEQAMDCEKKKSCPRAHTGGLAHTGNTTAADEAMNDATGGRRRRGQEIETMDQGERNLDRHHLNTMMMQGGMMGGMMGKKGGVIRGAGLFTTEEEIAKKESMAMMEGMMGHD
jgi:hypothetical protein